MIMVLESA